MLVDMPRYVQLLAFAAAVRTAHPRKGKLRKRTKEKTL